MQAMSGGQNHSLAHCFIHMLDLTAMLLSNMVSDWQLLMSVAFHDEYFAMRSNSRNDVDSIMCIVLIMNSSSIMPLQNHFMTGND